MKLARHVYVYALGLWTGAALFFGAVVAPGAFRVLERSGVADPRSLAGELVSYVLARLNVAGIVAASVAALAAVVLSKREACACRIWRFAACGVVVLGCALGAWVSARMRGIKLAMGAPIDLVPLDHPLRVSFNSLHGLSTALMMVAMLAALVALAVRPREEQA